MRRTRAGLGSGLELVLPTGSWLKPEIWMNAPVVEPFAKRSPYVLLLRRRRYGHRGRAAMATTMTCGFRASRRGTNRRRRAGRRCRAIGVLQGTYLGIYINPVCEFWRSGLALPVLHDGRQRRRRRGRRTRRSTTSSRPAARQRRESGITFVHLNGGFQGGRALELVEPFVRAIKEEVGLLVGVQLTPERPLSRYDRLIDAGVDHFSFCVELIDPEWFATDLPRQGAHARAGPLLRGDDLLRGAGCRAAPFPASSSPASSRSPTRSQGIERITRAGAFPTVCIFRPTAGSGMADWPSPQYEDMRAVMAAMYDACRRHRIPIGLAPNIEVSLVVNPDDAALLAPRTAGFYAYEAWRRALRVVARPAFQLAAARQTRRRRGPCRLVASSMMKT